MTELQIMQIKGALRKCAKENEGKTTYTGHVVISSVCNAAAERIEELEKINEEYKLQLLEFDKERTELKEEIKKIGKSAGFMFNQQLKQQIKEAKEIISRAYQTWTSPQTQETTEEWIKDLENYLKEE